MEQWVIPIVAALIGSPILYAWIEWGGDKMRAVSTYKGWQAVFLTNGQVYFGKVTKVTKYELVLDDIYYLSSGGKNAGYHAGSQKREVLVKLGDEIHGPQDRMTIGRAHVLFSEFLKEDSEIVKSIGHYESARVNR